MRMRIVAALFAFAALPATAGQVYKCKGPKGEVIFTNIRCPDKSEVTAVGTYQAAPDSPDQLREAIRDSRVRSAQQNAITYQDNSTVEPAERGATAPGGYRCSVDGKTWVQPTPCPASTTKLRDEVVDIDGHSTVTGQPIHGTAVVQHRDVIPVEQRALSRDDLCQQLEKRSQIAESGDKADSGYERRKMRHENCGR